MLYSVRNVLRLYRKSFSTRFNHSRANESEKQSRDFKHLLQQHKDKIVFSSYLEHEKLRLGHFKYYVKTIQKAKDTESKEFNEKSLPPLPLSLKYYVDKENLLLKESVPEVEEPEKAFQLPFAKTTQIEINENDVKPKEHTIESDSEFDRSNIQKWMTNYEQFDDTQLVSTDEESDGESVDNDWCKHYGTPDPTVAVSQVMQL